MRVDVRLVLLQLEGAVDELLRALGVSGLLQHRVAERGQRQRLHQHVALGLSLGTNLLHLDRHGRQVAEPPDRTCGVVAAPERRLELDGAEQLAARRLVLLARERTLAGARQRLGRLVHELLGWSAVELGEEERRVVEMVSTDLEQLFTGALLDPLSEPRMLLRARLLGSPAYATSRISMCLKRKAVSPEIEERGLAKHELAQQQIVEQGSTSRSGAR